MGGVRGTVCCGWASEGVGRVRLTAYVAKLPILEDQELLAAADFLQAGDGAVGEVVDDVGVRFQHADGVADFFGEL